MTSELLIFNMVRQIAAPYGPGRSDSADEATDVALHSFAGGASLGEACGEARRFLRSEARSRSVTDPGGSSERRRDDPVPVGAAGGGESARAL